MPRGRSPNSMRGLSTSKVKLHGGAAKRVQLKEMGRPANFHRSTDPMMAELVANLVTGVQYNRSTQTCARLPRSRAPRAASAKPQSACTQGRPYDRVQRVIQQARHYAVTAESADYVCAAVRTGRVTGSRGISTLDKTYDNYSAEVALLKVGPEAITTVHAGECGLCSTWVGVGPERAELQAFDELHRVYVQHGMDGFDLATWGEEAYLAYKDMAHLTETSFHNTDHKPEDPNGHQAWSSEYGWSFYSSNRDIFPEPWKLHTTKSKSEPKKAAAKTFEEVYLLPLLPHLWKICQEKFPETAAQMERHAEGSPYNMGGTPWNKVTCADDNPTLTHYDKKNKH